MAIGVMDRHFAYAKWGILTSIIIPCGRCWFGTLRHREGPEVHGLAEGTLKEPEDSANLAEVPLLRSVDGALGYVVPQDKPTENTREKLKGIFHHE